MTTKDELQKLFRKIDLKIDEMTDLKEEFSDYVDELREKVTNYKEHETIKTDIIQQYGRWKPEKNEMYWFIEIDGLLDSVYWFDDNADNRRYEIGNCYQSREQAEQALERLKIRTQLEDIASRLNKGQKIDWENHEQCKFYLAYDYQFNTIDCNTTFGEQMQGTIFAVTSSFYDVAVKEIGKERLEKYLKGE